MWFLAFCVVSPAPLASADPADCRPAELFITDTEMPLFEQSAAATLARTGTMVTGSTPLDGVFWSDGPQQLTFERSREFHLCVASDAAIAPALHTAAEALRRQFDQDAVLTFAYLPPDAPEGNAVTITVPGVDIERLGTAFASDAAARYRLLGGSVTTDHTLILVAGNDDLDLARRLVEEAGGRWDAATLACGRREFVT